MDPMSFGIERYSPRQCVAQISVHYGRRACTVQTSSLARNDHSSFDNALLTSLHNSLDTSEGLRRPSCPMTPHQDALLRCGNEFIA